MKNNYLNLLQIVGILLIALVITGCTKNKEPIITGIEVTTNPTKLTYAPGESFDPSGMVISLVYSDKTKKVTDTYQIDKTGPLSLTDQVITITVDKFSTTINITVSERITTITDVEVRPKENAKYIRTMQVSLYLEYREVYSDGTFGSYSTLVEEDIVKKEIVESKLKVTVSLFIQNVEYEKEVLLEIDDSYLSISELLTKEVSEECYIINGILVGIASTNSHVEYLLMDSQSKEIIGVRGLEGTGKINDFTLDTSGFTIGDELRIPVKLIKAEENITYSDSNKIYASYLGGTDYEMAIISKNNQLRINHEEAITINNQDELRAFLTSENRINHFYKVVKLHGKLNYIYYESSKQYRFFFDGVTSLQEQKIDNCSPCFASGAHYYTLGKTIGELLFNQDGFAPADWADPAELTKDIYAVFMGGNGYYHEFVILNEDDVVEIEPTFLNYTFTEPTNLTYMLNGILDLTGGAIIANYDYGMPQIIPLTLEMLTEIPDLTTTGVKLITGSYDGYEFSFEISVIDKIVEKIELNTSLTETIFSYRDGIETVINEICRQELRITYENAEPEIIAISENMVTLNGDFEVGNLEFIVTYLNKTITIFVTVELNLTSVSELKTKEPNAELFYDLTGIIIGQAFISGTVSAPANGEILIKDLNSNNVIGIRGLLTSTTKLSDLGLAVGDEVIIQVSVSKYTANETYSEYGKIYASSVPLKEVMVISHNNSTQLDIEEATNILCQTDLNNFLKDALTRSTNVYQLIKLGAGATLANSSLDTDSAYITFTGISVATVKIDGLSPFLHEMNQALTLGENTYLNAIFGEGVTRNVNFGKENGGNVLDKDIYLLYIGGQGKYYHQFILLDESYVSDTASKNLRDIVFIAPTKQVYTLNEELDLTGGKIEYQYYYEEHNEIVELSSVIGYYDMSKPGTKTITFTLDDRVFSYEIIIVEGDASALEIVTMPIITSYMPHTTLEELDLTGGILRVIYDEIGSILVPMEKAEITYPADIFSYYLGDVTFMLTYNNVSCEITFTFKALTITEFLSATVSKTYDITGIVVGPVSSQGAIELLIKEKNSTKVLGIYNTGLVGTTALPTLDTTILKPGDEIIASVKLVETTADGAHKGKLYANGIDKDTFIAKLEVISENNDQTINLETSIVTVITTQEELVKFLNNPTRFYTYVKLVGIKAISYTSGASRFYRFFFGNDVTSLTTQKVNNASPVFNFNIAEYYLTNAFDSYFDNPTSTSYQDPITTIYDIYALFVGGNSYYQAFIPLNDSWLVSPVI